MVCNIKYRSNNTDLVRVTCLFSLSMFKAIYKPYLRLLTVDIIQILYLFLFDKNKLVDYLTLLWNMDIWNITQKELPSFWVPTYPDVLQTIYVKHKSYTNLFEKHIFAIIKSMITPIIHDSFFHLIWGKCAHLCGLYHIINNQVDLLNHWK